MSYSKGINSQQRLNKENGNRFVSKAFRTIYFEDLRSVVETDNPHAFLQLKFSPKLIEKRYDIVYIIIEKVINTGDAIFRSSI